MNETWDVDEGGNVTENPCDGVCVGVTDCWGENVTRNVDYVGELKVWVK